MNNSLYFRYFGGIQTLDTNRPGGIRNQSLSNIWASGVIYCVLEVI